MMQISFRLTVALLTFAIGLTCVGSYRLNTYSCQIPIASREAVLRDDLFQIRKLIDQHAADRGFLPYTLDDLVKAGYLREIPLDPVTGRRDWIAVPGHDPNAPEGVSAVIDVRSRSSQTSSEGSLYSQW
jgi:general secretion pathway protein G